jgi:ferredoxin
MPTITVEGEKSFEAAPGTKLVLAIEDAGIDILHRCGGQARCTTCRVHFIEGEPSEEGDAEHETLEEDGLLGQYRLSCQVRVSEEDMIVQVWGRASEKSMTPGDRPEA